MLYDLLFQLSANGSNMKPERIVWLYFSMHLTEISTKKSGNFLKKGKT